MELTEKDMYYASQLVFLPISLLLSFGLCQYLFLLYYNRRKELRGVLLLMAALVGFVSLVPLAHPNEELVHHLNDISEACSTLTFLLQITIIGRASNKKVKIRSIYYLTLAAELLIAVQLSVVVLDVIEVFSPRIGDSVSKEVNQAVEDISLVFIFAFRFYYLALIKGFRELVRTKKMEICIYFLFLTHEYPFIALEESTHVLWEFVQGIYHRLIVTCCIWLTVKDKLRRGGINSFMTTKNSQHFSQASQGNRKRASESIGIDQRYASTRSPSIVQATAAVSPAPLHGPSLDTIQ
uniref:Intimal thickness related receptor IRP domain-containing protein n=1 Tax=Globisporangium ultimum (strain ATCC 200006 / CBS 805.95 / DAOM BR144) TaxID=431595 RepID=K3WY44_GLOUD